MQLGQGLGAVKGGVVQKGISFNAAQWLPVSITLCCAFTRLMCFIAFHFYSFNLVLHSLIYVLYLKVLNYSFSSSFLIHIPLFILLQSLHFFPHSIGFPYSFLHFMDVASDYLFHGYCIIILMHIV